jgi:hypothetical protein
MRTCSELSCSLILVFMYFSRSFYLARMFFFVSKNLGLTNKQIIYVEMPCGLYCKSIKNNGIYILKVSA